MFGSRSVRVVSGLGAAALVLLLAGCGTPPWEGDTPTSPPAETPSPTATVGSIVNELAGGVTEHTLVAGDASLSVRYWSTLSMDKWVASANKPVSLSLQSTLGTDRGQGVYLSRVSLSTQVLGPLGPLPSPPAVVDQANLTPGYQMKDPYTYSQTFVLPELDSAATGVVLTISYEVLIQTTPKSTEYAKQTAVDTLTIAIAPEPHG